MADKEATQKGSDRINPAENLDGWLDKKLDAESTPAKDSAPAEPTVAEPAPAPQPVPDWKDVVLPEDIDHGFFRGKKVGDLYQSYRHVETAKQQAERERNEWRQRAEQLQREREAETAARKVFAEQTRSEPQEDPRWAKVNELWFADPPTAQRLLSELNREEATRIAEQKAAAVKQEFEAKTYKERVVDTGYRASETARQQLGLDEQTWRKRGKAVYLELTDQTSEFFGDGNNLFRPEEIVRTYKALWGESTPQAAPVVVKSVPELPPPPGAKKPATINEPEATVSPLSREKQRVAKQFADIAGIDPKRLEARWAKRQGENRG